MLVDVWFPYTVRYLPPRARVTRNEAYLSRITLSIRELSARDAPLAYRMTPADDTVVLDGTSFRKADQVELIAFEGDVWWPVRNLDNTADISIVEWTAELGKKRGNHTLTDRRHGQHVPDILGLKKLTRPLTRLEWPNETADHISSRHTFENTCLQSIAQLERAANDIVVRDGRLFVRAGEPMWLLAAPIRHFQGGTIAVDLHPVPQTSPLDLLPPSFDPHVAFIDYELFRIDRKRDATHWITEKLRQDRSSADGRQFSAGKTTFFVEILDALPPAAEPLAPMLHDLANAVSATTDRALTMLRSSLPPALRELPHQTLLEEYAPSYLQRLEGLVPPGEKADAGQLLAFFDETAVRLDGLDLDQEPFGWLRTLSMSTERARRRTMREIARGGLPSGVASEDLATLAAITT